ncbi:unnamed protein product [Amoebophrya sp. A120]|nr:unnamed protein product [Amoebophrya sp. A120]|eukprot:GSA120T00025702001.1
MRMVRLLLGPLPVATRMVWVVWGVISLISFGVQELGTILLPRAEPLPAETATDETFLQTDASDETRTSEKLQQQHVLGLNEDAEFYSTSAEEEEGSFLHQFQAGHQLVDGHGIKLVPPPQQGGGREQEAKQLLQHHDAVGARTDGDELRQGAVFPTISTSILEEEEQGSRSFATATSSTSFVQEERPGERSEHHRPAAPAPPSSTERLLQQALLRLDALEAANRALDQTQKKQKEILQNLRSEDVELDEKIEDGARAHQKMLSRIRFAGAVYHQFLHLLAWINRAGERSRLAFAEVLMLIGYLSIHIGTILPWCLVVGSLPLLRICSCRLKRPRFSSARNSLRAALETNMNTSSGDRATSRASIEEQGSSSGPHAKVNRTSRTPIQESSAATGLVATQNQKGETTVQREGEAPDGGATVEGSAADAEVSDSEDNPFPYDFIERGTLSNIVQDSRSAEGRIFTVTLTLYMICSLLAQAPFIAYDTFCPWRNDNQGALGHIGDAQSASHAEAILRALWTVLPSLSLVLTAVLPAISREVGKVHADKHETQLWLPVIHNLSAFMGGVTLLFFETLQLCWGENVPLSYLFAIFDPPIHLT